MEKESEKILVIEDEDDNLYFILQSLKRAGYTVVGAKSGEDGLTKFKEENPDLVILDVLLPEMDGWEVLKKIKTEFKDQKVPVILLTVKGKDKDKLEGYIIGADYYIPKPFNIQVLLQAVVDVLQEYSEK